MAKATASKVVGESDLTEESPVSETPVGTSFAELYERAALPFDKTFQRQIRGGRMLDYITGEQCISRMQEVYQTYDWEVGKPEVIGTDVIVSGRITVKVGDDYISRSGFGGCQVKQFGGVTDLGNDVKAAETAAFKRAAARFGVGLYLYERDENAAPEPQAQYTPQAGARQAPSNLPSVSFPQGSGNGTTGVIQRKSATGLNIDGTWYNVSKFKAVPLDQFNEGMTVTISHAPGKTFIDGVTIAGGAAPAQAGGGAEDDEAF